MSDKDDLGFPSELPETPPNRTLTSLVKTRASKTKESLLHILDESFSDYSEIELTEEEAVKLSKTVKRLGTGASTFAVMHCEGNKCPISARCELAQMNKTPSTPHGKAPVGNPCLLEATIMRDSMSSYIEEYEVDPVNYTEVNIVSELAEIEVILWRINMQLSTASQALLVIDQTIGFDRATGRPIQQQQISPLFEQKNKLLTRKSKLVKLMVGDRQEKYKKESALKQKSSSDTSTQMAAIRKQLGLMEMKLKKPENIIEAEVVSPEEFLLQEQNKPEEQQDK